jgi:hypothetical protein
MTPRLALCITLLSACVGDAPRLETREPGTHPAREDVCTSSCVLSCRASQRSQCESCYNSCIHVGSCDVCSRSCYGYSCIDYCAEDSGCDAWDYRFWFDTVDAEVGRACRTYFEHEESCGHVVEGDPCSLYERTEDRRMVAAYECLTEQSCEDPIGSCVLPQPTGLIESLCAELEARCPGSTCNPDLVALVEHGEGWLRPEVVEAAMSCIELVDRTCDDYVACVEGWAEGAFVVE